MSLKDKLEKSPMISLVIVCTAVGSAVFGVAQYFHNQQINKIEQNHAAKLLAFEAQLAQIQMGIDDRGSFNLQEISQSKSSAASIPSSSQYFIEDNFYAIRNDSEWSYTQTTENELMARISGKSFDDSFLDGAATLVPVHLWSKKESFNMRHESEQTQMSPMIMVQRISFDHLRKLLGYSNNGTQSQIQPASYRESHDSEATVNQLFEKVTDDLTGKFFQFQTWIALGQSLNSPKTRHQLNRVQKLEDALYSESTIVMQDAIVNGQNLPAFFVHNQMILISNEKGLYFIKIIQPSTEPVLRENDRADINRWLGHLRIITSK